MDFQTRKLNLISYLTQIQDESLLATIENFILRRESRERGRDLKPFTVKEFIARIKESEKDFKEGNFKTQEELEKLSENW